MREQLDQYIAAHRDEMIATLKRVVAIPSYRTAPKAHAPYGEGPARVLEECLKLAEEMGFPAVVNVDDRFGYAEFGEGEEVVGVFAHFDVVPEGQGWLYPPYEGQIHDGWIYGRGVVDDKGPGIASLYGMKAIMDLGLPLRRKIRFVFGIDEEEDMSDMDYYMEKLGAPALGFSPDAQFPVSFAEKAWATVEVGRKLEKSGESGLHIVEMYGGDAPCNVADRCYVVLKAKDEEQADWVMWKLQLFAEKTAWDLTGTRNGTTIRIDSLGKSGHPYTPRLGQNAISQLIMFLDRLGLEGDMAEVIHIFREKIGMEYYGEHLGIDRDDVSGYLTFSTTHLEMRETEFSAIFKMYRPYYFPIEEIVEKINEALLPGGVRVTGYDGGRGAMHDRDSVLIRTLSRVYTEMTGLDGTPRAVGGTYSKVIPTICGFGSIFPGTKDMCHVVNEALKLDEFVFLGKIYANAVYALANVE